MEKFSLRYGIEKIPENANVISRKAAKAVVMKDHKVLMILTSKGDYKFPGGGYKKQETVEQCLSRELLEETGYLLQSIDRCVGMVSEENPDIYEEGSFFSMQSEYYWCTIDDIHQQKQMLDDYEKEQDFTPVFVDVQEAADNNKRILSDNSKEINTWVRRETDVLIYLLNNIESKDNE